MSFGVPHLDGRFLRRDLTRNPWIWRTIAGTFAMFSVAVLGLRFALPDLRSPEAMFALSAVLGVWALVLFRAEAPEPGSRWAHAVVASTYVGPALAMLAAAPHGVIGVPSALFAGPLIGTWMTRLRDTAAHVVAATAVLLAPSATGLVDADTFLGAISLLPAMWVVTFCIVVVMGGVEEQGAQLDALVRVDPLTGVGNRRRLDEVFAVRLAEVAGGAMGFAVLTLDLDGFKSVNDQLGHDAGDALLRHVAGCLAGAVGPDDVVVRQGGDEFCVVLASADERDVTAVDRRIRAALLDLHAVAGVPVSSGIGHASCPADGTEASTLLAAADARLLHDKAERKRAQLARGVGGVGGVASGPVQLARAAGNPPAAPRAHEGVRAFPNGIGRRELEHNRPVWLAHAAMYLIYTAMGAGVTLWAPHSTGPWFPYVWTFGGVIGVAYLLLGPPRIGTTVNHLVVALTYVVPALILWSCAPGGSFAVGTLLFVGPLAAARFVERPQIAAHIAVATACVVVAMSVVRHDVWTILALLQTMPVVAILGACCVAVLEIAERQTLELHRLVRRDPLTGLGNRRRLSEEIAARSESGAAFSVITFDLNGFKQLNDTHGHAAGDDLLREVAECLTASAGPAACVARQGGDEFAIVHTAADAVAVADVAGEIRARLSHVRCGDAPLTTGIGWALAPADGVGADELLGAADRALLLDKSRQRGDDARVPESRLTA